MTLAAVLPQVVGALRAFDPYERGVALNQLAQVCELSFARGPQPGASCAQYARSYTSAV
jgi:hypothetical protein